MVVSGTDLFNKCHEILQKPQVNYNELEKVFHDLNLLLDTSFKENDEHIATLWFHLGSTCLKRGHMLMALTCFDKAIEDRPAFLEAINNKGYIYKKIGHLDKAKECYGHLIDLVESGDEKYNTTDQIKAEFYTNYGSMFVTAGTPDKAIEIFEKAKKLSDNVPLNEYNLGLAYLEKGNYEKGFKGYDIGERPEKHLNRNYSYATLPYWDGSKGKNLVVIGEQGIGDELMFGTIIPDVAKDCHVVLDAHPRLADMFRRSFPNIDVYGTRKDACIDWGKRYKLDAKVLIGSLPKYYRKEEKDFPKLPYLVVDPKLDEYYANKLNEMGNKPKIGISWRGGSQNTGKQERYIPLENWLPILKLDCDFISLQYDGGILPGIEEFNAKHNVNIHHWVREMEEYERTAAIVKNLDLIISVPQSVIHLSGAIGQTLTWQLCPIKTLWPAGPYGKDMPWYPNVINIWQKEIGNWDYVMNEVKERLCSLLQTITKN